jgi:hypothetical protein
MSFRPLDAQSLLCETAIDSVVDHAEPYELCKLRERLSTDRERLQTHLENPDAGVDRSAGYLGFNELFWVLAFSWADLQDYVEEANSALVNEEAGFRSEWFCVKELTDGSIVPDRPRIHRRQTLDDYVLWGQAEEKDKFPITAWEEEDYRAATEDYPLDDEEERIPWEDYDQDDLNKMDRQLSRGY